MTDVIRKSVKNKLINNDFKCEKEVALSMFSGKYKMAILVNLSENTNLHFSELQLKIPEATKQVLAQQLKELVTDKLIMKNEYIQKNKRRTLYSLTTTGKTLIPIFNWMSDWGESYISKNFQQKASQN
ncbi:winged helix-turn-helix transcriptional regulator [Companilactobacillus sp. DQM5]|uniref:winged helix-turn-helix transcriptional regulator n=1 Tax=Companilactobacillus sp. DQM5 TaxID=3463359 RepID=UPI004058CBD8